jgi:protein phosphatase PTC2/3
MQDNIAVRARKKQPSDSPTAGVLPQIRRSHSPRVSDAKVKKSKSPVCSTFSQRSQSGDKLTLPSLRLSGGSSRGLLPRPQRGKFSDRSYGAVKGFAVHSVSNRHHNEDRVSIILNIPHPEAIPESSWPSSSFYALYDGHAGKSCADFLKHRLHTLVFSDSSFPWRAKEALVNGFLNTDAEFLAQAKEVGDMAGACAITVLVIGDKCFVANAGDSRALISMNEGKTVSWLIPQHRPGDTAEYSRLTMAGGKVYSNYILNDKGESVGLGPLMLAPGKLKVSRALGDLDAKDPEYGGNPKVLIPDPDVKSFKVKSDQDFILIANGGLFDKLSGREVTDLVFRCVDQRTEGIGEMLLKAAEDIVSESVVRMNEENATVIIIALKGLKQYLSERQGNE